MNGNPSQPNAADMLAHVTTDAGGQWRFHGLSEHLHAVATLAGDFAEAFGARVLAEPAGRWRTLDRARVIGEWFSYESYSRCIEHSLRSHPPIPPSQAKGGALLASRARSVRHEPVRHVDVAVHGHPFGTVTAATAHGT